MSGIGNDGSGTSKEVMEENQQEQDNEIIALESIYADSPGIINYSKSTKGFYTGCIRIRMPKAVNTISVKATSDEEVKEITVNYLPPLMLNFVLTEEYPSTSPPIYELEALWLSHSSKTRLVSRLSECWEMDSGMPILYTWIELLKDEGLDAVHAEGKLDLDILLEQNEMFSEKHLSAMDALRQFRSYDEDAALSAFEEGWYDCEVCCRSTTGKDAIQFLPCNHTFCVECVSGFYRQKIINNSLRGMCCLTQGCESAATQTQLKRVLTEEEFERYDKLLLQGALDVMTDVVQCPRLLCQAPVIIDVVDDNDHSCRNLARCSLCEYAFCSICRKTYHGLDPCDFTKEQRDLLISQYEEATPEEKAAICRKMGGRIQFEKFLTVYRSENWISENTKKCPSCRANIEKKDGCNKMFCTKCNHFFCWLCGTTLNRKNPYEHFSLTTSNCYNRLFEGMIVDEAPENRVVEEEPEVIGLEEPVENLAFDEGPANFEAFLQYYFGNHRGGRML